MNPLHVGCHLCHAAARQPCRWGTAPGEFHSRRTRHAEVLAEMREQEPEKLETYFIDTVHSLANGDLCTPDKHGICTKCGQEAEKLRPILG